MHPAAIKNIVNDAFADFYKRLAVTGCPTSVGCGKTKELDNEINGHIRSKLTNMDNFQKDYRKKMDYLESRVREALRMTMDAVECTASARDLVKESKEILIKSSEGNRKTWNKVLVSGIVSSLLMIGSFVATTAWSTISKVGQDQENQKENISVMRELKLELKNISYKQSKLESTLRKIRVLKGKVVE